MGYKRLSTPCYGFFLNLVSGLTEIDKPINEAQAIEAQAVGLNLVSRSTNPNMNLYEFKECKHKQYLQPTHVRRNNFKCNTCLRNETAQYHALLGATYVFSKSTQRFVIKPCGHSGFVYGNNNQSYEKCTDCYEENLRKEATEKGLRLLGKSSKSGVHRLFQFVDCGHTQDINAACIPVERFRCQTCKENSYALASKIQGLEYLGKPDNEKYGVQRRLYKLPCGCTKAIRMDHAASGSWLCDNCSDSHYTKPSNVYLLKLTTGDFSWLKLGFAKDLNLRTSNYGLIDTHIDLLCIKSFDTGTQALKFEKSIHKKYKQTRYKKDFMKNYMLHNGFTECYPIDMQETLFNEIECYNG